jgi:branched-chain amino acid transport system substrate-binding protein
MRRSTLRLIAATMSLTLFAAACGGDDGGDDADGAATDDAAEGGDTGEEGEASGDPLDVEAILSAGTDCEAPEGEPLLIGYAADLSEVGGYADQPGSEAAAFMAELINCSGGIDGTPVEVVVQDIQGDPDVTQRAAQDLLDDGVHAILGPPFSDFGLPLLQVVAGQVPVVFVASTEALLPDPEMGSYLMAFDDEAQAGAAATFAADDLGAETAVTLSSADDLYFEQVPEMFGEAFEEQGGEVVSDYSYSLADSDFSSQVNQIAGLDEEPDVIYTSMIMPMVGTLLGQLRAAGVESDVIGADSFDATGVVAAGEDAEGVYYTTHGFPGEDTRLQAFLDAFAEEGGEFETVSFGALAGDAVLLVADAYRRAGELDPGRIGEEIEATRDLELITETVSYEGQGGIPEKPVFVHQIVDGELELATTITP